MNDAEVIASAELLCWQLARNDGWAPTLPTFLFHASLSPRAQATWDVAAIAFDHLCDTDINDALTCCGLERPTRADQTATLAKAKPRPARQRR